MTDETKTTILQTLNKLSGHYGLQYDAPITFKKREEALLKLKSSNEGAWKVASDYVNAHIKSDRILSDKEKQAKKPEHWNAETIAATTEISRAEKNLADFCNTHKISI